MYVYSCVHITSSSSTCEFGIACISKQLPLHYVVFNEIVGIYRIIIAKRNFLLHTPRYKIGYNEFIF